MCLDRITPCLRRPPQRALRAVVRQRGFSVIAAIFLLVVLAALGAFMLTFSTVQQTTGTQDLQGARGYQAARSGVEWGRLPGIAQYRRRVCDCLPGGNDQSGAACTVRYAGRICGECELHSDVLQ